MNRREALSIAAVAPLAAVPIGAGGMPVTDVDQLVRRVQSKFKCVDGPPRAFFEGVSLDGQFGRGVYVTFINGTAVSAGERAPGLSSGEEALNALWQAFIAYSIGKQGTLYWRKKPELSVVSPEDQLLRAKEMVEVSPGLWQERWVVEDGLIRDRPPRPLAEWGYTETKYFARMRLVITETRPWIEEEEDWVEAPCYVDRATGEVWRKVGKV